MKLLEDKEFLVLAWHSRTGASTGAWTRRGA